MSRLSLAAAWYRARRKAIPGPGPQDGKGCMSGKEQQRFGDIQRRYKATAPGPQKAPRGKR